MDFVINSTNDKLENTTDWKRWIDKYVSKKSELYNILNRLIIDINQSNNAELNLIPPYQSWINKLKSKDILVESIESTSCFKKNRRFNVILDDLVIAIINKEENDEYKYICIPANCYSILVQEYFEQLY